MTKQKIIMVVVSVLASIFVLASCASAPKPERETPETVAKNTIKLEERFILDGHIRGAQGLSFNPTETQLASGGWDNHVFVWDYEKGTELFNVPDAHRSDVVSLAYDEQGQFFVSAGLDRTIKAWNAQTGEWIKTFNGFNHNVIGVDIYRDPNDNVWIAGAVLTGEVVVLDYATGDRYATFGHESYATNVAFSPDGSFLASTGNDQVIYLWDLETKQEVRKFEGHSAKVNTVSFSPDGSLLASGAWDNTVRLWDVQSGEQLHSFNGYHTDSVEQVQFSTTGRLLASGARDGLVNIFTVEGRENVVQYDTGNIRVYNVVFNNDSTKVAVTGYDHLVRVYDLIQSQE